MCLTQKEPSDSAPTAHRIQVYLLQVLGPVRRLGHGHEAAVGQDGAHDEQTEQGEQVKEEPGPMTSSFCSPQQTETVLWGGGCLPRSTQQMNTPLTAAWGGGASPV